MDKDFFASCRFHNKLGNLRSTCCNKIKSGAKPDPREEVEAGLSYLV